MTRRLPISSRHDYLMLPVNRGFIALTFLAALMLIMMADSVVRWMLPNRQTDLPRPVAA